MQIGCSADWFFECVANGKPVYDTLETGNRIAFPMTVEDHLFDIPVQKGTNLVVVRLLSGGKGWRLHCGAPRKAFVLLWGERIVWPAEENNPHPNTQGETGNDADKNETRNRMRHANP